MQIKHLVVVLLLSFSTWCCVGEKRLLDQPKECLRVTQGAFYASLLSLSLSFIFLKLFLYTQTVVCVLYRVHVLYSVHSFWSSFYTKSVFYTRSAVRDPQSPVHVLYWLVQKQTEQRMGCFHCNLYQTKWMFKRFILGVKPCETHEWQKNNKYKKATWKLEQFHGFLHLGWHG